MKLSRSKDAAIVMTEDDVSKLNEKVRAFIGEDPIVEFVATCMDAIRTFDGVKKLKEYENSRKKKIKRLDIRGRNRNFGKTVLLSFGSPWTSINVDMEGPETAVESHLARIEEVLDGLKPWYSWFAKVDFVLALLILFLGFWILLLLWVAMTLGINRLSQYLSLGPINWTLDILFAMSVFLTGLGLNKVRAFFFPKVEFVLGQGKQRYKNLEFLRQAVLVGLAISFASSLVASYLFGWFQR